MPRSLAPLLTCSGPVLNRNGAAAWMPISRREPTVSLTELAALDRSYLSLALGSDRIRYASAMSLNSGRPSVEAPGLRESGCVRRAAAVYLRRISAWLSVGEARRISYRLGPAALGPSPSPSEARRGGRDRTAVTEEEEEEGRGRRGKAKPSAPEAQRAKAAVAVARRIDGRGRGRVRGRLRMAGMEVGVRESGGEFDREKNDR